MQALPLKFSNVTKTYGVKKVLDSLSFEFQYGAYALSGDNGVGKSTLLTILCGAINADTGKVMILGHSLIEEPVAAKSRLSFVPDKLIMYPFITGEDYLRLICHLKKDKDIDKYFDLAENYGLGIHLKKQLKEMSFGTQKKMMLIAGFIGEPTVIIMDEPTNGLDKNSRAILINELNAVVKEKLILFSSHDREFVDQVATHKIQLSPEGLRQS